MWIVRPSGEERGRMDVSLARLAGLLGIATAALLLPACKGPQSPPALTPASAPALKGTEETEATQGRSQAPSQPAPPAETDADFRSRLDLDVQLGLADQRQFYTPVNLGLLALGVGAAAPLANTSADQTIRDWYQHRIRRDALNPVADVFNIGGQVWVAVPVGVELAALLGWADEEYQRDGGLFEWSNRSLRAAAVGYP